MLYYVELEKYEARYTLQLTEWNVCKFKDLGVPYTVVSGQSFDSSLAITTGEVLDAFGRCFFALTQTAELVSLLRDNRIGEGDVLLFEDMFHPGIEALAYALSRTPKNKRPKIAMRCLAQTIDPDDFVNRTGMAPWMRHYEHMVDNMVDLLICHSEEMVANMRIAGWRSRVAVTGLPYSLRSVRDRAPPMLPWSARQPNVLFASRFDDEKQPLFFLEVARYWRQTFGSGVNFVFLSGNKALSSNNPNIVQQMREAAEKGLVSIELGLKKEQYYGWLTKSKVLFNCALQDWVSNTACEADTLGCNLIYPAYRSFPETFFNDARRLYVPWSVLDAVVKLAAALDKEHPEQGRLALHQDQSIERTLFALGLVTSTMTAPNVYSSDDLGYRRGAKVYS